MIVRELLARLGFKIDDNKLKIWNKQTEQAKKHMGDATERAKKLGAALGKVAAVAATAAGALVGFATKTSMEFESLRASLKTVTGSADAADAAFARIRKFAGETPYSVQQITEAFVKLKALGLDPSEESLRAYGNTASAMNKDLMDMIEAVADATTGEFERLKEFGIKASQQGDKVSLTFQGVTTTIGKNADEISAYLKSIGNVQFAGAMAEQMNTLRGIISNLQDNFDSFLMKVGEGGLLSAMKDVGIEIRDMIGDSGALARTLGQALGEAVREVWGMVKELAKSFRDVSRNDIHEFIRGVVSALKSLTRVVGFLLDNWGKLLAIWGIYQTGAILADVTKGLKALGVGAMGASSAVRALGLAGGALGVALAASAPIIAHFERKLAELRRTSEQLHQFVERASQSTASKMEYAELEKRRKYLREKVAREEADVEKRRRANQKSVWRMSGKEMLEHAVYGEREVSTKALEGWEQQLSDVESELARRDAEADTRNAAIEKERFAVHERAERGWELVEQAKHSPAGQFRQEMRKKAERYGATGAAVEEAVAEFSKRLEGGSSLRAARRAGLKKLGGLAGVKIGGGKSKFDRKGYNDAVARLREMGVDPDLDALRRRFTKKTKGELTADEILERDFGIGGRKVAGAGPIQRAQTSPLGTTINRIDASFRSEDKVTITATQRGGESAADFAKRVAELIQDHEDRRNRAAADHFRTSIQGVLG